jgi:glycosyltransferase involved in cell wall biosynthesis
MHLLVDIQALQTPSSRNRGIGRYTSHLLDSLARARPGWEIELVESTHLAPADASLCPGVRRTAFAPPLPVDLSRPDANELYYGDWLTDRAADAVLVASFIEGAALVPQFTGPRPPLLGILYDLIPLLFAEHYLPTPRAREYYGRRFRQMLATDCLLAISQASANDLGRLVPGPRPRVVAIGGGADPAWAPHPEAELARHRATLLPRLGLERDFLLYVGGFDYRKNLVGGLRGFAALPEPVRRQLDLVIVGDLAAGQQRFLRGAAAELGIADSLKLTGFVSDAVLAALYQLCRLFYFPSLYEGMGLPVVEALSLGTPVVALNTSSIPEYAGSDCALAESGSPEDLAAAITAALREPRDARLGERVAHARGFRWGHVAELACREVEALARPRPVACRPRRRRVAWCSPVPPAPCAGVHSSGEVLRHLAARFDIEVIVAPEQVIVPADLGKRHLILSGTEAAARHRAEPYDAFLYHVGNSQDHAYLLSLLWRYRGLVVLHDDSLARLVLAALRRGFWPVTLEEELVAEGQPEVAAYVRKHGPDAGYLNDHAPLTRRVLRAAGLVVTHSASVCREVRRRGDTPVVWAPAGAARAEPAGIAECYAAALDVVAEERASSAAVWTEFAADALSPWAEHAGCVPLVEAWAALRDSAQGRMGAGRPPAAGVTVRLSA